MNHPEPTPADMLAARPVRNHAVRTERNAASELVVYVPLKRRWFVRAPLSWVLPVHREKGVVLDKLGEEIWDACDGHTPAERIIETFAQKHHLRFHEARLSVMSYLRQLMARGLVVMVGPTGAGAEVQGVAQA